MMLSKTVKTHSRKSNKEPTPRGGIFSRRCGRVTMKTEKEIKTVEKLTMLYIHNDSASFEKVAPALETYYKMLDCETIDIVQVDFNGEPFDVICDDEALLKEPPYSFSVISKEGHPMIAGNILVCKSENGAEKGLKPADVIRLMLALGWTIQNDETVAALIAD